MALTRDFGSTAVVSQVVQPRFDPPATTKSSTRYFLPGMVSTNA